MPRPKATDECADQPTKPKQAGGPAPAVVYDAKLGFEPAAGLSQREAVVLVRHAAEYAVADGRGPATAPTSPPVGHPHIGMTTRYAAVADAMPPSALRQLSAFTRRHQSAGHCPLTPYRSLWLASGAFGVAVVAGLVLLFPYTFSGGVSVSHLVDRADQEHARDDMERDLALQIESQFNLNRGKVGALQFGLMVMVLAVAVEFVALTYQLSRGA